MVYNLNGTTLSTGGSGMLNVLDYGFKGDGTTDNLAAFNALIAAHPAETLYFPACMRFPASWCSTSVIWCSTTPS